MLLHLKIETLMWLLPIVFMFHDFEEIIMFSPWLNTNWSKLEKRFPRPVLRMMSDQKSMSTSAFALAVAEEFIVLAAFTLIAVEFELYNFWTGLMLGFFIHLLVHIGQYIIYRGYVPVILTSIPAALYCMFALHDLNVYHQLNWGFVTIWTVAFLVFIAVNMIGALKLAAKFETWLVNNYKV